MVMHQSWQVCPDCSEMPTPDPDCPLCDGMGVIDYEFDVPEDVDGDAECPKCGRPCHYRGPDHPDGEARYCDHCGGSGGLFRTERGWPDILDHLDE